MTDILDSTKSCEACGGCGVLFGSDSWVGKELQACDTCHRFKTDLAAAEAAQRMVREVYANNARAMDLKAGTASVLLAKCSDCPCHFADRCENGYPDEHRCNLLDAEMYHAWDETVAPNCPLKTITYILRA